MSRRQFLALMGASLALAGLTGCSVRPAPERAVVPYVRSPEEIVPGRPLFFATTMTLGTNAVGLLVESHMGRPTKIEGNPEHPASLGATDPFLQASVLGLYDPDRSQTVTHLGQTRTWEEALAAIRQSLTQQPHRQGAGLRVLTETTVSPTFTEQMHDFLAAFPRAQWHQFEPLPRDTAYQAAMIAFGRPVNSHYDFKPADVVVSLDCDFLCNIPGNLRYVADFMSRRRVRASAAEARTATMNRLYAIETAVSSTGAKADHRLAVKGSQIEMLARALAAELQVPDISATPELPHEMRRWVRAVADDLRTHDRQPRPPGTTLVIAGDRQPPMVHVLAHAMNRQLGNVGRTVFHTQPIEAQPAIQTGASSEHGAQTAVVERIESLRRLAQDMHAGRVEVLLILGGNPAFTAPADFHFKDRMQRVPLRIHLGLHQDETARQCHWHLPEAHFLEAWSDARAYDGTVSIAQPLIEPLYAGRSAHELVDSLTPREGMTWREIPGHEIVKSHWRSKSPTADFETFWQETVHDGVMAHTALAAEQVEWLRPGAGALAADPPDDSDDPGYELTIYPDATIGDGRFANNGWLQELPKLLTELTWDNAAIMSPTTARALGIGWGSYAHGGEHGGYYQQVVELQLGQTTVRAPAWIMPGHADGCISVHLGYGRDWAGKVGGQAGHKVGFNAYALRNSNRLWFASDLAVRVTAETSLLACVQQHHAMENRETVRAGTLAEFHDHPRFAFDKEREALQEETRRARMPLTLYQPHPDSEYKWGMAIDLTTCIGCKACVVACQAENNIAVVGKDQVARGREMHWLRVDRYISGPFDRPREFHFQPVPCMHCENAPCEYVCPVEATVHSAEGLNEMLYQRCVGTRFCSNNCPYKVRRFNFLAFSDYRTESIRQQYNPDVTVRSRGVMEKCSYCVQRIRHAEIDSQVEGRSIFDGEILTACQAACPAQAIIFGDMKDRTSKVMRDKDSPLHYALLADENTQPRTTYLAALRNPNPAMESEPRP